MLVLLQQVCGIALVPYKGALKVPARGRYYHYVSDHIRLQRILCYVLLKPPVNPVTTLLGLLFGLSTRFY